MKSFASAIEATIHEYVPQMNLMDESSFSTKLPGKWSKKEIVGHLVDSAQNNLQRFIRGQYEATPPTILYDQNEWVKLGHYENTSKEELIFLWRCINLHICHVLKNMDPANYEKQCKVGNDELKTLLFFAEDYHRHMLHHLNQIKPINK